LAEALGVDEIQVIHLALHELATKVLPQYEADAAIHETMEDLHDIGAIDKQTMREFDDACLTPVHVLAPEEIKAIRAREHISQPVFARYLNVSKNLVSDWERGVKKPGGSALRLLTVIQKKGLEAIA
jgi:putative transcriptional regulator